MGFALCRFYEDEDCEKTGSIHWDVYLSDLDRNISVPYLWKHYALDHRVQPTIEERSVIMAADPKYAKVDAIHTRGVKDSTLNVFYVERLGPGRYTHKIGEHPDIEFIGKLESILIGIEPLRTKSI